MTIDIYGTQCNEFQIRLISHKFVQTRYIGCDVGLQNADGGADLTGWRDALCLSWRGSQRDICHGDLTEKIRDVFDHRWWLWKWLCRGCVISWVFSIFDRGCRFECPGAEVVKRWAEWKHNTIRYDTKNHYFVSAPLYRSISIAIVLRSCGEKCTRPKTMDKPDVICKVELHRENPDQTRGGGLAIIYRDSVNISPRNHNITHTSFEFQLVNIGLKSRDIVLANIYRPPSSSKSIFLEEFGSLLASLGTDAADRLMICGDFNLPGMSPDKIDDDLTDLLNSTGFTQHINASTRHDSHYTKSLLAWSHHHSIHFKICFYNLCCQFPRNFGPWHSIGQPHDKTLQTPPPPRSYQYRDIKNIDLDLFNHNILSSSLFSNPHPTVDGYADQMETEITSVLDKLAPLKTGRRSGPRRARNWLSPEAIEA